MSLGVAPAVARAAGPQGGVPPPAPGGPRDLLRDGRPREARGGHGDSRRNDASRGSKPAVPLDR